MNAETRKTYLLLSSLFFFFFFTWSSTCSLLSIWLNQYVNLKATDTGIIFAAISLVSFCSQPLYGYIQDKLGLGKHQLWVIAALLVSSGPFFMGFADILRFNIYLGGIVGGLYIGATFNGGIGLLEAYIERFCRMKSIEYGRARMWGSLGWAVATFFAGINFNINPWYNFALASVSGGLFLLSLSLLRIAKDNAMSQLQFGNPANITLADALGLLRLQRFWALVIFVIGTCVYGVYDQQFPIYFSSQFPDLHSGNTMYGYLNSLQVFLEAGGMFLAPFLVNRIGAKNGLLLASAVMALRVIGSGLVSGVYLISMMKLLHAIELPILLISLFKYNSLNFDKRLSSTIYLVGFTCISSVVSSLLSPLAGYGYELLGFAQTYLFMGSIVLVTTLISCVLLEPDKSVRPPLSFTLRTIK
ncbi:MULTISPECIES: oligosaccharide MFS transporter [unclassified Brenneria]|uniref:oligosaccharide MFS transporter n=1 Tax=unclassified Brenneria TaxID=2634434 RepID=UPI001557F9AA|nr:MULTISPECIES: oligosaccharide MFS transporter [unclassified Brenneria]MBJ7220965.1 oligosaccharide MFS transporter [Brenneria sp. L3-3C-1]MEE3642206.1 oligosaccharide MFS transporter [Brenneria sp. L3_3C_1]MEE3650422.1 oligosaccharide MFS transporter [Brenneria sp. HEZEL_4_2_4]NPD00378.1 oligosaccharide MFS transporter [Brenneria sp. hezel4-2-4]